MPKRLSQSADRIKSAKRVLDEIIAKQDPAMESGRTDHVWDIQESLR